MRIFYCVKSTPIDLLKDRPTSHKSSKIKIKFADPKAITRREFTSVDNIEYLEVTDSKTTERLRLAELYDRLMNREIFETMFEDLDHHNVFEEYRAFNEQFYKKIQDVVAEDDLIVVNDSSLFLLPSMTKARVAFRNLRFEGCFIEKVPFYRHILKNIVLAQKFFDSKESLDSFNNYMMCSYEMRDVEKGGCWYLKPYADKFAVIDTLEHILKLSRQSIANPACLMENKLSSRFNCELLKYLCNFEVPKIRKCVLTDVNLIHIEPFIKKNPHIHTRYLRSDVDLNEETSRMIQYLKKMYSTSFSVADPVEYTHIVAEMFFCDVFVGTQYREIAQLFGRPVIDDSYDPFKLSEEVERVVSGSELRKYSVIGEEEYLREFMEVNGYKIVLNQLSNEDEAIDRLSKEICALIYRPHKHQHEIEYYKKITGGEEDEIYVKKGSKMHTEHRESYHPIMFGENSYFDLKNKMRMKKPEPLNKEEVKRFWKESNKTILLDYDGTLTPIIDDPDKAVLSARAKDILMGLSKASKVVICSGRSQAKLDEWIPKEIEVYAEHGAFHRINGEWRTIKEKNNVLDVAREIMEYYLKRTPGTIIEEKTAGLGFHYRQAKNFCIDKLYTLLRKVGGENVQLGKMVIEIKASTKDCVCKALDPAICVGDDRTDEDMFKVCKGISIKVGEEESHATFYIKDVDGLLDMLSALIE